MLGESGQFLATGPLERTSILNQIMELEEADIHDLKQKAKVRWTLEGDENTRFLHGMVQSKYRKVNIHWIKINGLWVSKPSKIKDAAFHFFKEKFSLVIL